VVTQTTNLSRSAKRESLTRIPGRYPRAGRPHQPRLLDEFCAPGGDHRPAALRFLNRPRPTTPPKRRGPQIIYDPVAVRPGLKRVWRASDLWCRKRLQAALPEEWEPPERRAAPRPEAFRKKL